MSLDYATHENADLSYKSRATGVRLENGTNESVGYILNLILGQEDKPATAAATATVIKSLGNKAVLRLKPWAGAALQTGLRLYSRDLGASTYSDTVYGLEATQRFLKAFTAKAAFSCYTLGGSGTFTTITATNYSARLAWQPTEKAKLELWYGREPFAAEMEPAWPSLDETMGLSLEASF